MESENVVVSDADRIEDAVLNEPAMKEIRDVLRKSLQSSVFCLVDSETTIEQAHEAAKWMIGSKPYWVLYLPQSISVDDG